MEARLDQLLKAIVEEYLESANPVGSALIAEKHFPELSSATIRNAMADLEEAGLIFQPYTSAGRIPTIKGYERYLTHFLAGGELSDRHQKALEQTKRHLAPGRDGIKALAKQLAEICQNAIVVGFSPHDSYYTGIANLFRQPEFAQQQLVYSLSDVIDRLDEVMPQLFDDLGEAAQVLIGSHNPFGATAAVVIARYHGQDGEGIIGIIGPTRMDFSENLGLVEYVKKMLENL